MANTSQQSRRITHSAGRSTFSAAESLDLVWTAGSDNEGESLQDSDGWRDDETDLFEEFELYSFCVLMWFVYILLYP